MNGRPILTADAMRAAEQAAIDSGTSVKALMERAGTALADAVYRFLIVQIDFHLFSRSDALPIDGTVVGVQQSNL